MSDFNEKKLIILATRKVHGRGRVQIPKIVRDILKIEDGDLIYFVQDEKMRIFIERAPRLAMPKKIERRGKYL